MILGFLGKGGSGKSSVSSQMALFLNQSGKSVLAIDADHNLDLSFNLSGGESPALNYLSQSVEALQQAAGFADGVHYSEAFLDEVSARLTLTPLSPAIESFSTVLGNDIRLMAAGPQTDDVLHGQKCSHSLTTSLRILLPILELQEHEVVVLDEKAGADGVSTGTVTGIDVGIVVCEPALHSIKTAKQIAELMEFYNTPYLFVGNKVTSSEDKDFIAAELGQAPVVHLMESTSVKRNPSALVPEWTDELQTIVEQSQQLNQHNRLERSIAKFKRNQEFATA